MKSPLQSFSSNMNLDMENKKLCKHINFPTIQDIGRLLTPKLLVNELKQLSIENMPEYIASI